MSLYQETHDVLKKKNVSRSLASLYVFDKTFGNFINLCQICREVLTGLVYTSTWSWIQVYQVDPLGKKLQC